LAIILPANTLSAGGYAVDNSCRFNDGDSPSLSKTMVAGSTDFAKKFTISVWFKLGATSGARPICSFGSGTSNAIDLLIDTNSKATFESWDGSVNPKLATNRLLRDYSAWYNIIVVVDTTQATDTNRMKMYINGVQETSFASSVYPSENYAFPNIASTSDTMKIGNGGQYSSNYYDGYIAEFCYCDGQVLAPTDFGEFDEDSPTIWKPIDVSGLTFGNAGTYCDFKDSDNLGDDESGNTNDLTENNIVATDQATDTPTNNFCTWNPLNISSMGTLSEGNCLITGNSAANTGNVASTMAAANGKWYAECKVGGTTGGYPRAGFQHTNGTNYGRQVNGTDGGAGGLTDSGAVYGSDGKKFVSDTLSTYGASFANDNIVNLAIDCDNGAAYVGVNNAWSNSSDPTSGASKTGAILTWTPADVTETGFAATTYNSSNLNFNFGNPAYANSSDAADADGYGKFEYAPPSGYFALCTKNLAEYG